MPPAVAVAGIGAAASIGGAVLGSKAQKKAAKKAAQSQAQVAQQNNALTREIYGQNAARLDPYAQSGMRANNAIMELLLGPAPAQASFQQQPATSAQTAQTGSARYTNYPDGMFGGFARWAADQGVEFSPEILQRYGMTQAAQEGVQTNPGTLEPIQNGGSGVQDAWERFRQGTNYQWRLGEGQRALNSGYAAAGTLQSGDAMRALQEHGQNFASNELMNYFNLLNQQQNVGLGGASALAGVGQNMVTNISQNNQNAADAAANAALLRGQANANMWGGIASGIGTIAGAAFPSSYGR